MSTDEKVTALAFESAAHEPLCPFQYPSFEAISEPNIQGLRPPSEAQRRAVEQIIAETPKGPRPIDVAESFIDRFYKIDPHAISQWFAPQPWNPLIVNFFDATSDPVNNDTVPWCAAFLNWCLRRAGKPITNSSSSQSFASTDLFAETQSPIEGDIVVFTCYSIATGKTLGLGHVTFFKEKVSNNDFFAVGGNQSGVRPSMICREKFLRAFESRRHVGGNYVPVMYRINRFLRVA
jgi:uncharacterized protein (TIGR02594 family)